MQLNFFGQSAYIDGSKSKTIVLEFLNYPFVKIETISTLRYLMKRL